MLGNNGGHNKKNPFNRYLLLLAAFLICALIIIVASTLRNVNTGEIFKESCDTWNTEKWGYYWNPPTVSNGTWVFSVPAYLDVQTQANYLNFTGYGTYEVRLKTSGPRVAGTNWYVFLYYTSNGDYDPSHQELDFAEVWNSHPIVSEYTISLWANGETSTQGIGYWYINVLEKYGINFEDGNFHVFKYVYNASEILVYVDEAQIFKWSVDCTNKTAIGLPVPPMHFMIGAKGDGTSKSDWSLTVDYIKHYD